MRKKTYVEKLRGSIGEWAWHVHHTQLVETLSEYAQERVDYIKRDKPKNQIKTRLRWFRRVKDQKEAQRCYFENDYWGLLKLHKKEHPDCPWRRWRDDQEVYFPMGSLSRRWGD